MILILLFSCKREPDITLSDDICEVCNQSMIHYFGNDSLLISEIITPNGDGYNDHLMIYYFKEFDTDSINFYDRKMNLLATYSPYNGEWPNIPFNNGKYYYELKIDTFSITGSILLLSKKDEYYNIAILSNSCGNECQMQDIFDPIVLQ